MYHTKIKTPFELVVFGGAKAPWARKWTFRSYLVQWTGRTRPAVVSVRASYRIPDKADAWVNTGALLSRMNFSPRVYVQSFRGAQVGCRFAFWRRNGRRSTCYITLNRAIQLILGGPVSQETRETLEKQMDDPQILQATLDDKVKQVNVAMIAGLVLGSPEFQRR